MGSLERGGDRGPGGAFDGFSAVNTLTRWTQRVAGCVLFAAVGASTRGHLGILRTLLGIRIFSGEEDLASRSGTL
jgi:hypothetical protein